MKDAPDSLASLRDAFLPLTDAGRVGAALRAGGLLETEGQVECIHIQFKVFSRMQSWSRAHARLCYRLGTAAGNGSSGSRLLHGWAGWLGQPDLRGGVQAPMRASLGKLELRLWAFPHDDALPGLKSLWTAPPRGLGAPTCDGAVRPELISYRPGNRAVLRYAGRDPAGGAFAKVFPTLTEARRIHQRTRRLHAAHRGGLRGVPPLCLDEVNAATWSAGVAARHVLERVYEGFDAGLARQIIAGLIGLQCVPFDDPTPIDPAAQRDDATKKLARLARLCPPQDHALRGMRKALEAGAPAAPGRFPVALHGDFHLRQGLTDGDTLTLCDLDEVSLGAGEVDLASLMIDLAQYGLPSAALDLWLSAFIREYASLAPWGLHAGTLDWQLRAQAVNKIHRAGIQLHRDLAAQCQHYLIHLDRCLSALHS